MLSQRVRRIGMSPTLRVTGLAIDADFNAAYNVAGDGVLPLSTVLALTGRVALPIPHFAAYPLAKVLWMTQVFDAPPMYFEFLRYLCVADTAKIRKEMGFAPRHDIRNEQVVGSLQPLLLRLLVGNRQATFLLMRLHPLLESHPVRVSDGLEPRAFGLPRGSWRTPAGNDAWFLGRSAGLPFPGHLRAGRRRRLRCRQPAVSTTCLTQPASSQARAPACAAFDWLLPGRQLLPPPPPRLARFTASGYSQTRLAENPHIANTPDAGDPTRHSQYVLQVGIW